MLASFDDQPSQEQQSQIYNSTLVHVSPKVNKRNPKMKPLGINKARAPKRTSDMQKTI